MNDAADVKNPFVKPPSYFIHLLTKGHSRSVRAKMNILLTFFIRGGNILIGLFLVPLTIHYVNASQYGIWITLTSIIGWFGFFDIGFGLGLRNKLTECIAHGEHVKARIYISTTYAVMSIIIAIVLIIFLIVNPHLNWSLILNSPKNMAGELSALALIVFLLFCLQFVLQLITTILMANQQTAQAFLFIFIGNLLSVLFIFILTKTTTGNLVYLGTVYSLAPLLALGFASVWFYGSRYKQYAPALRLVHFPYARNLMTIGIKFFFIQISGIVLYQTSNIIIIQLFGASSVTSYNLSFKYFSVVPMVISIIMTPLWSAFTEAWVKKDLDWIRSSMSKLKLLWVMMTIVALCMLFASGWIYKLWVGKAVCVPFKLSVMMTMYVIVNAWNAIFSQFLNGVGKIKLQLYVSVADMLIHIPLAIFLGSQFGVPGVILSSVILCSINMIWVTLQYNKLISDQATGIWSQ